MSSLQTIYNSTQSEDLSETDSVFVHNYAAMYIGIIDHISNNLLSQNDNARLISSWTEVQSYVISDNTDTQARTCEEIRNVDQQVCNRITLARTLSCALPTIIGGPAVGAGCAASILIGHGVCTCLTNRNYSNCVESHE